MIFSNAIPASSVPNGFRSPGVENAGVNDVLFNKDVRVFCCFAQDLFQRNC